VDINATCAFVTHLKTMNVVALRGQGVDSSVSHHFVARFSHAKRLLRSIVWSLANNFEVTQAHFTFKAKRANTSVRVVVCGKYSARFHAPLNDEERRSSETWPKPNARFYGLVRSECTVRNLLQTRCQ